MIDFADPKGLTEALCGGARRQAVEAVRGAQRALPRTGSLYRRGSRRARRDHHRHQHGRPRHRHSARRQRRDARDAGMRRPRRRRARREGSGNPRGGRGLQGEGDRRRRPLHHRHRAPREPAHRQPAARPLRPSGRSRPLEILPVAAGRPDAHLRLRAHGFDAGEARPAGGRSHRPSLDQQGDREGAAEGRGAQLRHPQEHPQVRQRHERPAQGRSSSAGAKSWRGERRGDRSPTCAPTWSTRWSSQHIPHDAYAEAWDVDGLAEDVQSEAQSRSAGRRLGEGRRHRRRGDSRSACSRRPTTLTPSASRRTRRAAHAHDREAGRAAVSRSRCGASISSRSTICGR